ncbi:MAG TPA: hypothetical protein VIL86_18845 [Tepidisphaeraceae bacterium]|jgi:hypothetical protein
MRRKLFTILAAVSLLLLAGVVVVGVRSFWVSDSFSYAKLHPPTVEGQQAYVVGIQWGRGGIRAARSKWIATTPQQVEHLATRLVPLGFAHSRSTRASQCYYPLMVNNQLGGVLERLGFGVGHWVVYWVDDGKSSRAGNGFNMILPAWFLALLLAVLPALWLRRRRIERKRNRVGFCKTCGYDLRATPLHCPECGTVVPAPPAPAG